MTDPIKPTGPGAPSPAPAAEGRAGFRAVLDDVAPEAPRADAPAALPPALASLAAELRAGALDPHAAVDALVRRHVEGPAASALTPAGRAALERHLRDALATDPSLLALVRDLGG